jgi:hypothetical protein
MTMPASRENLVVLGNRIRAVVFVVYLAWIAMGFYVLHYKAMKRGYLQYAAAIDLPVGHRVRATDFTTQATDCPIVEADRLSPSELKGKYLLSPYTKGKMLDKSDLSATPLIELGGNDMKYVFPLQKQLDLVEILNTGSRVDICSQVCVVEDARVLSIVGPYGQGAEYYAILDISVGDDAKVKGEIGNYRLFLRTEKAR